MVFQPALVRYAVSLALTVLAVFLKWVVDAQLGTHTPFFVFFLPSLLIAWFAGIGPSMVSATLAVVAAQYISLAPGLALTVEPAAPMRIVTFLLEVFAIGWLAASRKAVIIRLNQMEQRYRILAESIPQFVWVMTPNGETIYQNHRLSEYAGLTDDETAGSSWLQLIHPEDLAMTLAVWQESLLTGSPLKAEYRLRAADGSYHWFLSRSVPVRDARGRIVNWFGTATDIDDEKLAQKSAARLAAIVETSDIAIIGKTPDGTITSWNLGAERIYGYRAVEVIGHHVSMLVPPHLQDELRETIERINQGERIEQFETTRVRKDGRYIPISLTVSPIHDSNGRLLGLSAIGRDITARKLAEEQLKHSEERFRIAADTAPVMIWMRNGQGVSTFCNKTYAEFVGRAAAEVLHHNWMSCIHPGDQENCRETFRSALIQRASYQMEYRLRRADGESRWIVETGVPRYATDGAFEGFIGSCVDITTRKWAEQALRGAFDELEVQAADSLHELHESEDALRSEKRRRERAEETLKKFGL
jgi:PAS domain S-box-containing protein